MRAGGGHAKGSEFERWVCQQMSLWASDGQRADIFSRNIMSGGRFTIAIKSNDELGMPGDIRANHPLAYTFLNQFLIECKHYKTLGFDSFIFDKRASSMLSTFLTKARKEAQHAHVNMMLIGKQNNRRPFLMLDVVPAQAVFRIPSRLRPLAHHLFHANEAQPVYMFDLAEFISKVWLRQWLTVLQGDAHDPADG